MTRFRTSHPKFSWRPTGQSQSLVVLLYDCLHLKWLILYSLAFLLPACGKYDDQELAVHVKCGVTGAVSQGLWSLYCQFCNLSRACLLMENFLCMMCAEHSSRGSARDRHSHGGSRPPYRPFSGDCPPEGACTAHQHYDWASHQHPPTGSCQPWGDSRNHSSKLFHTWAIMM